MKFKNTLIVTLFIAFVFQSQAQVPVTWTSLTGITVLGGNRLQKAVPGGFGTAGASSTQIVAAYADGCLEYTVGATNDLSAFGFTQGDPNLLPGSIEYSFVLKTGGLFEIAELGNTKMTVDANGNNLTFAVGDVFSIHREKAFIIYKHNNKVLRTITASPAKPLNADLSMQNQGSFFYELTIQTSGGCHKHFTSLQKKLNDSFYTAKGGKLLFKYEEKYKSGTLDFYVYDDNHDVKLDATTLTQNKIYGTNWFYWRLSQYPALTVNNYYLLEVRDEKGRSEFLRFYYSN